ncbi:Flp pilus assembly protein CpaB, partial [bacterium]|nr:Flp pilus assembly protein CpaB [bacterium]
MSKKVALFVLIIAIFSGLIASATVVRFVRQLNQPSRQAAPTLEHVVMSTQKIAVGEKLTLSNITLTQRKNGNIPQGAITKLEEAVDKTAKSTIFAGEILLSQRLAQAGAAGNLAAKIPAGHRAITLRVDDSSGVAGFIQPGCMVDVLSTFDTQGGNESITKVILQNVKVLAKGR